MTFASDCMEHNKVCVNDLLVVQGEHYVSGVIEFQLRDYATGNPLDMTPYLEGSSSPSSSFSSYASSHGDLSDGAWLLLKEAPMDQVFYVKKQLEVVSPTEGKLKLVCEENTLHKPGMFVGMVELWRDNARRKIVPLYFAVDPTLKTSQKSFPLTVAEVRLAIRDSCPDVNFLLDSIEYENKEIAFFIRRAVDYWNEVPPPVTTFTPTTFPFRYNWMEAVVGQLMMMIATWKLRNHLQYSADGVNVDDTGRWRDYLALGQERWKAYQDWVKNKKIEINIDGAFIRLSSGYSRKWWINR